MFTLHLLLAVFTFSIKWSSFALESKVRIIWRYCRLLFIFQENVNANLTFAVNEILNWLCTQDNSEGRERLQKTSTYLICENRFCLHKTETRTDGETLQNHFGKGLSPGEHSLAAGRTEISYGKRISLRQ